MCLRNRKTENEYMRAAAWFVSCQYYIIKNYNSNEAKTRQNDTCERGVCNFTFCFRTLACAILLEELKSEFFAIAWRKHTHLQYNCVDFSGSHTTSIYRHTEKQAEYKLERKRIQQKTALNILFSNLFTQMVIIQIIDSGWVIIVFILKFRWICSISSMKLHTNGKQQTNWSFRYTIRWSNTFKKCLCVRAHTKTNKCMNVYVCIFFAAEIKMPCARNLCERRNEKEIISIIIGHMHNAHSMRTWNDSCMSFIFAAFCRLLRLYQTNAKCFLRIIHFTIPFFFQIFG